jgi:hypothetical protein
MKKKLIPWELFYFNNTLIPLKELKSVDSLVNLLSVISCRKLMWNNMDYKIYGIKGEKYWFTKRSTRIKTNAKVKDIMNHLRNKLKIKYNNPMIYNNRMISPLNRMISSYPFYLSASYNYNSISKRLIKMNNK